MTQASGYTQVFWEWHLLLFQMQEQKEKATKAGLVYTWSVSVTLQFSSFIVLFISTTFNHEAGFQLLGVSLAFYRLIDLLEKLETC